MSKQKRRSGPGKPQGVTYAQVLARQAAIRAGLEKAARDATVQAQADAHTQRAMWLMVYSISDAYGYGPKGMQKFFAALQENTEELERMRTEVDEEYAFEKLRQKASRVTGMEVHYLEDQLGVLKEMRETQQMTPFS
nr:hypothetical protein [uncultured Flavonifractor sp.]